ncbi:MAG: integration host factor subunit beta [Verrucomicrobiales bacterium]|nr:integration host factor subunit beta [Verrucomicrobiales bacterium]
MTKQDIVIEVSRNSDLKLKQDQIKDVLEASLESIVRALGRGSTVELRNFGVFKIATRKPRVGRNPRDPGVDIPIPARSVVKFRPGKEMRTALAALQPAAQTAPDANA